MNPYQQYQQYQQYLAAGNQNGSTRFPASAAGNVAAGAMPNGQQMPIQAQARQMLQQAQARQAVQGAQGTPAPFPTGGGPVIQNPAAQGSPLASMGSNQAPSAQMNSLPVPPTHVANYFAQMASKMHPQVLGTLIWRALQQHGQALPFNPVGAVQAGIKSQQNANDPYNTSGNGNGGIGNAIVNEGINLPMDMIQGGLQSGSLGKYFGGGN